MSEKPISPLRRRMIEDMSVRKFGEKTQHDYIRHIEAFARFLGRSPATATAEDLRRYQVHQTETGVQPPTVNSSTVALRSARFRGEAPIAPWDDSYTPLPSPSIEPGMKLEPARSFLVTGESSLQRLRSNWRRLLPIDQQ